MTITLYDLITPVTIDEAKTSIYATLASLGIPTTSWKPKSVVRAIVWVMAAFVAGWSTLVVLLTKAGFRGYATGDWLTINARQVYGVERIAATFASGDVTLTNGGGGVFSVGIGELTVRNTTTDSTFHNTAAFTLTALGTATVPVIADLAGSSGTSGVGDIDDIVTTMLGVTCTNSAAFIGTDEETDEELSIRSDATLDAISPNGAPGAYLAVARAAEVSGANVGVNRVRVNDNSSTGDITVTVAKADGALSGPDLSAVEDAITLGDSACVPLGINSCTVQSAVDKTINVTMTIRVYTTAGYDATQVEGLADAVLEAWLAARPIAGDVIPPAMTGYIYVSGLVGAVKGISPYIFDVTCTTPAANVALAANEVAVLGATSYTVEIYSP